MEEDFDYEDDDLYPGDSYHNESWTRRDIRFMYRQRSILLGRLRRHLSHSSYIKLRRILRSFVERWMDTYDLNSFGFIGRSAHEYHVGSYFRRMVHWQNLFARGIGRVSRDHYEDYLMFLPVMNMLLVLQPRHRPMSYG